MDAVRAAGLCKTFAMPLRRARVEAVRDLSLAVPRGSVFGLLGPNGSGKTTTLLMLLGLLRPTAGRAEVLGNPAGHRESRRRTGFLPEETRLYEFLTGLETLDFAGRLHGLPRGERRRRAEALLDRTGVGEARNRRLATYSKGMARRVGLAQALMGQPELLVLDEPTSGLDPVGNREVKDLLADLAARGTTVLLSSHLLADVADVCHAIAIVHKGRKVLDGAVDDLLARADRTVLEVDALDDARRERVKAALAREGVAVHSAERPRSSLEQLFLDTLERDAGGDPP